MASYSEWNEALIVYFTTSASRGSEVYLSVDGTFRHVADALGLSITSQNAMEDFCAAVQTEVVCDGTVCLQSIGGRTRDGNLKCVAFLGALVLAAANMGNSHEASSSAYFIHLRRILGLSPGQKASEYRPPGLPTGAEERFWLDWNQWLQKKRFLPTASRGEGLNTFIHYSGSQCLLRKADRDRLGVLFAEFNWPAQLSPEEVITRLRWRLDYGLTTHLRELLDSSRAEAATDFVYEIYEERFLEELRQRTRSGANKKNSVVPVVGRPLLAGLLRRESWVSGGVEYLLLPRRQPHRHADKGSVRVEGQTFDLRVDETHARWFEPIGPLSPQSIAQGTTFPVAQPNFYGEVVLPKRDFWVLTGDAEGSGDLASWGTPQYGVRFVLLLRESLARMLEPLRDLLLAWESEQKVPHMDGWVELCECAVVGDAWEEARLAGLSEELLEALRPHQRLSLSLCGGLRATQGGWCQNNGPDITVYGIPTSIEEHRDEVEVKIFRVGSEREHLVEKRRQVLNEPHKRVWDKTGTYRVEASFRGSETATLVFIRSWDELRARKEAAEPSFGPQWGQWRLCGAKHEEMDTPWAKEAQRV